MSKEKENYEIPTAEIFSEDKLKMLVKKNAETAESLYKLIVTINNAIKNNSSDYKNLFNEQYIIDWQDRLNKVSITQDTDIV